MAQYSEAHELASGEEVWWFHSEIKAIQYAKTYYMMKSYHHGLSVTLRLDNDIREKDLKIHKDYDISYVKHRSKARRARGLSNVRMVRHDRDILILATDGTNQRFFTNPDSRDLREDWITFGGHIFTLTYSPKLTLKIKVTDAVYQTTLEKLRRSALNQREEVEKELKKLSWYPSKQTLAQRYKIMRDLNHQRKIHKKLLLRYEAIK